MTAKKITISISAEDLPDNVLPEVHYGTVNAEPMSWEEIDAKDSDADRDIDDDAELEQTPPEVVDLLGFDPLEKV